MSFTPTLFLSNIKAKDGLARPNRFKMILPIPRYIDGNIDSNVLEQLLNLPNTLVTDVTDWISRATTYERTGKSWPSGDPRRGSNPNITRYLSLQCESAELPGKTLQTADVKIYGPSFKVPYQKQYNDISLGFICTNDFYERKLFDSWISSIMNPITNNLRFSHDEETRYMSNIQILQYDDFIKQVYAVKLIDAFPIGVAAMPLAWGDDGYHRLTVQFAYQKYEPIYEGYTDLGEAAASYFGAKSTKLFENFFRF
jgi:hypothetical protein